MADPIGTPPVAPAPIPAAQPARPQVSLPDQVDVFNPSGELVQIPRTQLQDALASQYQVATPEDIHAFDNEAKYGGAGQQALTFAEGAGKGATFGLSAGLETMLGANPDDIRGRAETNPISAGAGEAAGIVGSMALPGVGAGSIAARAGLKGAGLAFESAAGINIAERAFAKLVANNAPKAAIEAAELSLNGLRATQPIVDRVGSFAIQGAIENALFTGGDEVAKAIMKDPGQSVQTAVTDIGLSGLIGAGAGGAFGAVSPLWEATVGPKARNFLNMIGDRANGNTLESAAVKTLRNDGAEISDAVLAGASENPGLRQTFGELAESGTMSGEQLREGIVKARESVHDSISRAVDGGEQITAKEAGDAAKETLGRDIEKRNAGVRSVYDAIAPSAEVQVGEVAKDEIAKKLLDEAKNFGAQGSPWRKEFERFADRVMQQETVGHLDKLMTELGSEWSAMHRAGNFEGRRAFQEIRDAIREGTNTVLDTALPGAKEGAKVARKTYSDMLEHIGEISKAAGLGKVKSAGQFQEALEKIPSEKLATRLFDKNNVRALEYLQQSYPEVHELLAKQMRANILAKGTTAKGVFNPNNIFREIEKLAPEVRDMVFTPASLEKISASREFLKQIPERMNPSGTARTLDTMWRQMPAGGGAVVGMLTGGNPILGAILGQAGKYLSRDVPDAAKLSLLKFLGSSGSVDASAWKVAADLIERTYKGQKLIESSVDNVFRAGKHVLPEHMEPKKKELERIDKRIQALNENPEPLFDIGGKTAHYMPDHAQAMGEFAANAITYLNAKKPRAPILGILDAEVEIPKSEIAKYDRTLSIAQQPLMVLKHIKDGTLQTDDVQTMQKLYPQLYDKLLTQLVGSLSDAKSKKQTIPYHTAISLSMFLAQPLDSTMKPESIQAAQGQTTAVPQFDQAQNQLGGGKHGSMKDIGKLATASQTQGQARAQARQQNS